jgi:putative NIF3 family GTP cyclohydrolase 1 type 2
MNTRRTFLKNTTASVAGATLLGTGAFSAWAHPTPVQGDLTIQQVIDQIIATIPGGKLEQTVDTIKQGEGSQKCTGVVTTFMDNAEVIKKAASLGANFIVSHEPTFYNHLDNTEWLENDPVYQYKKKLIADNGIVVWRFHDYWHRHRPDGITEGFLEEANWKKYQSKDSEKPNLLTLPSASVKDIALELKKKLDLKRPFIVGDASMKVTKVGLRLGASGGASQINMLSKEDIELLVVGEINEWETAEYVRDAQTAGIRKAMIIIGHQRSEEPGMKYLVGWMNKKFPGLKTTHVVAGDSFQVV